jgi:hypothetical protein
MCDLWHIRSPSLLHTIHLTHWGQSKLEEEEKLDQITCLVCERTTLNICVEIESYISMIGTQQQQWLSG